MNQLTQTPYERLFKNFEMIVREYLKDGRAEVDIKRWIQTKRLYYETTN